MNKPSQMRYLRQRYILIFNLWPDKYNCYVITKKESTTAAWAKFVQLTTGSLPLHRCLWKRRSRDAEETRTVGGRGRFHVKTRQRIESKHP
jgi:hypothetical protein